MRRAALAALIVLAGCPDRSIATVDPGDTGAVTKSIPTSEDIDILFVIDNSPSTQDKQQVFSSNFKNFIAALDLFPTGRPNVHIGVVSTTVDLGVSPSSNCPHPDTADNGLLQNAVRVQGCTPPTDRYISDIAQPDGSRAENFAGGSDMLAPTLSCIAELGSGGCGFEAPLEAMKRALDGSRPENAGFLRDTAYLAVIILTDEDDASLKDSTIFSLGAAAAGPDDFRAQPLFAYLCDTPISPTVAGTYTNCKVRTDSYLTDPQDYVNFLFTLKDPSHVIVGLIGGDPKLLPGPGGATSAGSDVIANIATGPLPQIQQALALLPSCMDTVGSGATATTDIGRPAIRLSDFETSFADHGVFHTVCADDYSDALTKIGQTLFDAVSPCLEGPLVTTDIDPSNPGIQLDCSVSDVTPGAAGGSDDQVLLQTCAMTMTGCPVAGQACPSPTTPTPCWWIEDDPTSCSTTTTGLELHFVRPTPPASGTTTAVQCAVDQM